MGWGEGGRRWFEGAGDAATAKWGNVPRWYQQDTGHWVARGAE